MFVGADPRSSDGVRPRRRCAHADPAVGRQHIRNDYTIRRVHTASWACSSLFRTTASFGDVSPANNRGMVLGERATATFTAGTEADTGGITPSVGGGKS